MAIYSLNVASVGKTTHAAGTAGAHALYIARPDAQPYLDAEHMPTDANDARAWLDRHEAADRKNARIVDKIRLALPRELTQEQRAEVLREFCQDITGGRVPWFAGIHQSGKDEHNPHAHIIIRDRDIETGKRVLKWSDSPRDRQKAGLPPNAVEYIRERWEEIGNRALERAGHDVRIDRRTLEAQGIDREPTIHIGPRANHIEAEVSRPESYERPQRKRRLRNSRQDGCEIADYPTIDSGRTRQERNAEIIDLNLERAARSPDMETRERARWLRDQIKQDNRLERELAREARQHTYARRRLKTQMRDVQSDARAVTADEKQQASVYLKAQWVNGRATMKTRHDKDRDELKVNQSTFRAKFMRVVDITGRTKRRQADERDALQKRHATERFSFLEKYRDLRTKVADAVKSRHQERMETIKADYKPRLSELRKLRLASELEADRRRQDRAAEREQSQRRHEQAMQTIRRMQQERLAREQDRLRGGPRMR